jgi:hypothetical protein
VAELAVAAPVRATGATGEVHRYPAELDGQWSVGVKLNGGHLLAVLGNAAVDAAGAGHPHPVAVTALFEQLRPEGPELRVIDGGEPADFSCGRGPVLTPAAGCARVSRPVRAVGR